MVKTVSDLNAEIDAQFADNHSRSITPAKQRTVLKDIVSNIPVTAGQVLTNSGTPSDTTFLRGDNTWNTPEITITATDIATDSGTPSNTTVLYGDNTWKTVSGGGGTTVTGGGLGFTFDTLSAVRATNIPTALAGGPNWIATKGYYAAGDGGGWEVATRISSAPTDHFSYVQSGDGQYWVMGIVNGAVSLPQFGAKPMLDYATMPAIGSDQDCYSAFVAADRFIRFVPNGGIKLIVPNSVTGQPWFMGRTHSLYRCSYLIESPAGYGSNAFIRTPPYESGFIVGGGFGPLDYNFVDPHNTYVAGFAAIKRPEQAGAYNCYRCITGGTVSSTDDLSGTDPAATYTWGASQWKFERYVGPGSVWDYSADPNPSCLMTFRGLTFTSFWAGRTLPDFDNGAGGFGFGGSTDPAFNKWPNQDLDVAGFPRYQCGIGLRNRSNIYDCSFSQYNGFGLAMAANGDPELFNWTGNVDGSDCRHIVAYYNGKAGVHICGNNANAIQLYYLDTHANGRMGLEAFSFLGDNFYGIQAATDGIVFSSNKQYLSGATYNGFAWFPRLPLTGSESTPAYINEEPGSASNHAWTKWFAPTPDNGVRGTLTGSISGTVLTVTATSLTTIAPAVVGPPAKPGDMISGPGVRPGTRIASFGTATGGTGTYTLTGSAQTVSSETMTVMNRDFYYSDQFQPWDPTYQYECGGAFGSNNHNARNLYSGSYQEGGINPGQLGNKDVAIGGMAQSIDASRGGTLLDATGNWNNLSSYAYQFADTGKRLFSRTAVPIAGDSAAPFFQGDIVLISNSTTGSPAAYYCKAGGDPGTWVVWGGNLP